MKNINKVMVTGGLGFIGSHIVNRYLNNGCDVVILDSEEETSNKNRVNWSDRVTLISDRIENVDIHDLPIVDIVINSAAETHVDYSFDRPDDFIKANIIGLHNLVQFCTLNDIPILHLSTDEVIGTGEDLYENSMLQPTNPYSFTKAAGENLLHAYGYCKNLNWNAVRLNNTYGPLQFPDKLIPKFIYHLEDGEKLPLQGSGEQTRNFLHVEDFVDAVETVINNGENKSIYNVSTDEEYSIVDVSKMICDAMGYSFNGIVEYVEDRPFNDPCYHSKSEKLRKLGWIPKFNLKEHLPHLIDWYINNREIFLDE